MKIGALYQKSGECQFVVWAPFLNKVEIKIIDPEERLIPMKKDVRGYWKVRTGTVSPGSRYIYRLDGEKERPDPASAFQPEGVHRCSQVIDHTAFNWKKRNWKGIPLAEMIIYELHVGTFTPQGTFDGVAEKLEGLADLGINAINIMPVSQFPGSRNWGYDGVHPFAVQNSYGGPDGFKRLIDACHGRRIAVILDVVYNHLGPEGNYFGEFAPYFTDKYRTSWGLAVNFDDAFSDEVRNFFIQNALHWFTHYHLDALRLDAVHAIFDRSALPFLRELKEEVARFSKRSGRKCYLIAESDLNDVKIIEPEAGGGYGLDAQWCDDFHHALHSLLTGERAGYYADFGKAGDLAKSIKEGYVLSGQYSAFRKRRYGNSSRKIPASRFVVFSQNHDQVGNRREGKRLSSILPFESLKLAAGAVFLSPYIPLLFMGEEYAEESPFLYFTSFSDADLIQAVQKGRREEFQGFRWQPEPPDPQNPETYFRSKLKWERRKDRRGRAMMDFYHRLAELRKTIPALSRLEKENLKVSVLEDKKVILLHRWLEESRVFIIMNFNRKDIRFKVPLPEGRWRRILVSSDRQWMGPGRPLPVLLEKNQEMTILSSSLAVYLKEIRS
jgi:maltooligosyltrehalose trehalohydrolase